MTKGLTKLSKFHVQIYCALHLSIKIQHTQGMQHTGWGAQSWTVFCGPAAVAVGGCERKY